MFRLGYLCSQVGLFRGLYLALQCASDCFDPLELLSLDHVVGLLRPYWLKLEDSGWAIVPKCSVFHLFHWICLVDPLYLVQMMHFWTLWLFQHFVLAWTDLLDPP